MAEYSVSIHVNLGTLVGHLQRSLQRSIDLTSFALVAADKAPNEGGLTLPGAYFQIATAGNEALDFEGARVEFRK